MRRCVRSALVAVAWVLTAASVAAAPGSFNKTAPPNGAVGVSLTPTASWGTSIGAVYYEICIDAVINSTCDTTWSNVGTNTSIVSPITLAHSTTYYWQVRARDGAGGITYANVSTWWHFTTLTPPVAFSKSAPADGATDLAVGPVTLSWAAQPSSAGQVRYEFCYNDVAWCGGWGSTTSTSTTTTAALQPGTTYHWQIRAVNAAGTTYANGGTWWTFTMHLDPPAAFGKTSPRNDSTGQGTSTTLTWGASAWAASYEYCLDTTDDDACTTSWVGTGTNTSAVVAVPDRATRYFWQVRAVNASGTTASDAGAWWSVGGLRVSVGYDVTCEVRGDGTVACWGRNAEGQASPVPAGSFTQVSPSIWHTCAVRTDGAAVCWGSSAYGAVSETPVAGSFTQVASGFEHTCAVRIDGAVVCWGGNWEGQAPAAPVAGPFTQVAAGGAHTCALRTDGAVVCWGDNSSGQAPATPVAGPFTQVTAVLNYTCALRADSQVICWGSNIDDRFGLMSAGAFDQIAAGLHHACGVQTGGWVTCRGANTNNQVSPVPAGPFWEVGAGSAHTCGVRTDGSAACWGANQIGQAPVLGTGPAALTSGLVGVAYSATLTASGGSALPYKFEVVEGELPPGFTLNQTTGVLAGTSALAGTWSFMVRTRDANYVAAYHHYDLTIAELPAPTRIIGLSGDLAFGNVTVGTTATRTLTVTNTGNATLTVTGITYPTGFSGAWSGTIAAGGSQAVTVTFAPVAATTYSGTVTVASDATSGTNTMAASGTGIATVAVTVQTSPSGRTFTVDGVPYTAPQAFDWVVGSVHTIATTSPQVVGGTRYVFANWSDGGAVSHSVTAPAAATTYTATFATQHQLTTSVAPAGSGTVGASPSAADGYYGTGSTVQLTASPAAGYGFGAWSGDLTGSTNPASVTMSGPRSVTANFVAATRIIGLSGDLAFGTVTVGTAATRTLTVTNSGNSTLTVTGITYPTGFSGAWSGTIAAGGSQAVTVTFAPVAATTYSGTVTVASNATSGTSTIAASGTGIATIAVTVQTSPSGRSFTVDGVPYTASQAFDWVVGSAHTIATTSPQVVGGTRYVFANWSDGGAVSHSVTAPAAATTYTASFTTQHELTTYAEGILGGWVSATPSAADGFYDVGTVVQLTASPFGGYDFSNWSGDLTGSTNPASVTMNGPRSVTAHFVKVARAIWLGGDLAFGSVTVGTTATRTLIISNTGTGLLTVSGITYPEGFSGAWSGTIAASGSQWVTVTFAPVVATTYSGTVTVASNATSGTNTMGASGTGTNLPTYTIAGTVHLLGGGPVPGVVLTGLPGSPVTDAAGVYTATVVSGWSGTVTPTRPGWAFEPATRTYTNVTGPQTGDHAESATGNAAYDLVRQVPACLTEGAACDTGGLLVSRGALPSGTEPHQPNTLGSACADGTQGTYQVDESIERLRVASLDGSALTAGGLAQVDVTVWAFSAEDVLDVFSAADASVPLWVPVSSLPVAGPGNQVLSTTVILPNGGAAALRAQLRFRGEAAACSRGDLDDHDDVVVQVAGTAVAVRPASLAWGTPGSVPVVLRAQGTERVAAFSVTFDAAILSFQGATLGSGAPGATLQVVDSQAAAGRVGLTVTLPAGQAFAAGERELVVLQVLPASGSGLEETTLGFGDVPTPRAVTAVSGATVPAAWRGGPVAIGDLRVTSVAPGRGGTAGDEAVVITGTGFVAGQTQVWFGDVASRAVTVTGATALTAVTPPHAAEVVDVTVATPGTAGRRPQAFRYEVPAAPEGPDLRVGLTHSGSFTVGTPGVYTVQVVNVGGNATAGDIVVVDTLPAGMSYVSGGGPGWTCTAEGAYVGCRHAGQVAARSSLPPLQVTVAVGAGAVPSVTNRVKAWTAGERRGWDNAAHYVTPVINP